MEYVVINYLVVLCKLIGYYNLQVAGDLIGPVFYLLIKKRRKIAIENMMLANIVKNEREAKELALKMFQHLVKVVFEVLFFSNSGKSMLKYMKFVHTTDILEQIKKEGKGAVMVFGHYGNWEMGTGLGLIGYKFYPVIRPPESKVLYDLITRMRMTKGIKPLVKFEVSGNIMNLIRSGNIITIDMDQNAGSQGIVVKFFGRDASSWKTPAILSLRYGCPVLRGRVVRKNQIHYMIGENPIYPVVPDHIEDKIGYLIQLYVSQVEDYIRHEPSQWLWLLKRWKLKS